MQSYKIKHVTLEQIKGEMKRTKCVFSDAQKVWRYGIGEKTNL